MSTSVSGAEEGERMVSFGMRCTHSTERGNAGLFVYGDGGWARRSGLSSCLMRVALALVLVLAARAQIALAQDTHWLDVESRIQYGYFTEDLRALRALMEPLTSNDAHDGLKSYYAGLLAYRQAQLAQAQANPEAPAAGAGTQLPTSSRKKDRAKGEARQMIERCVSALDHALEPRKDFADALALRSACLDQLAALSSWRSPLAGSKSSNQLRKALQLAPKTPRVLLLEAISDNEYPGSAGGPRAGGGGGGAAAAGGAGRAGGGRGPGW